MYQLVTAINMNLNTTLCVRVLVENKLAIAVFKTLIDFKPVVALLDTHYI